MSPRGWVSVPTPNVFDAWLDIDGRFVVFTAISFPPIQGFYVVATNNKEDVWVTKLPFSSF
jgi:hypothetical protein